MNRILIIGAGAMAHEYIKALESLKCHQHIAVLSRSEASANALKEAYGLQSAYAGGEATLPQIIADYDAFIVASPIETLPHYAALLAEAGARKTLLEKPGFLYSAALERHLAHYPESSACIAANRMFFPSIAKLRQQLKTEEITSAEFSFTEWVHRINIAQYDPVVLARWGISNCVHVIATVFDIIGMPQTLHASQTGQGAIDWHPKGAVFTGNGISVNNIAFSYNSDWQSAGRWSITIRTTQGAYHLCPMEGLDFVIKGSIAKETILPPYEGATKCGFIPMLAGWLDGTNTVSLKEFLPHLQAIESMFGYEPNA